MLWLLLLSLLRPLALKTARKLRKFRSILRLKGLAGPRHFGASAHFPPTADFRIRSCGRASAEKRPKLVESLETWLSWWVTWLSAARQLEIVFN